MLSILTVYVLFALTTGLTGLAAGWWLRSRGMEPQEAPVDKEEVRRAHARRGNQRRVEERYAARTGQDP